MMLLERRADPQEKDVEGVPGKNRCSSKSRLFISFRTFKKRGFRRIFPEGPCTQ